MMRPSYGEIVDLGLFWYYIIGFCCIMIVTCIVVYVWWALSGGRHVTRDIIETVNETIVIYDMHDKPCYVNLTIDRSNTDEFLCKFEQEIEQSGVIPEDIRTRYLDEDTTEIFEGVIQPFSHNDSIYSWKMRPVVRNNKYYGRVIVFSDITQYVKLHEQLDRQNNQLKAGIEAQRQYADVVKRLGLEEERQRIITIVNDIAQKYLTRLEEGIEAMGRFTLGAEADDAKSFEDENEKMILITRDAIEKVRGTIREIRVRN